MRSVLLTLGCFVLLLSALAADKLAVAEPQTGGGVGTGELAGLAHFLEAKLGGDYELYSRASLRQLLGEWEFNQSGLVLEESAKTQLRQQGVKYLLTTSVTRVGSRLLAVLTLVDAETGRVLPHHRAAIEAENPEGLYPRLEQALNQMGLLEEVPERTGRLVLLAGDPVVGFQENNWVEDEFTSFLLKAGSFELLTRGDLPAVAVESALVNTAQAEPGQKIKLNRFKVADYLAIFDLTRFERTVRATGTAIAGVAAPRWRFQAELTLRLIDVATGRVLAVEPVVCRYESTELSAATRREWTDRDYLRELARRLAETAGRALLDRIDPILVAQVEGNRLLLTRGEGAGVTPGQLYTVYNPGPTVVHPRTGKELGSASQPVGEARILSVVPGLATAELLPGAQPVAVGADCRLKSEPETASPPPAYPKIQ